MIEYQKLQKYDQLNCIETQNENMERYGNQLKLIKILKKIPINNKSYSYIDVNM